jgi:hypothetical protein
MRTTWIRVRGLGAGLVLAAMVAGGSAMAAAPRLADPQPAAAEAKPGLAVRYYKVFFRLIEEFVRWRTVGKGTQGEPLPMLNYKTGNGFVMTSDINIGVGADISGFIHLDAPGTYSFVANSNDGFRLTIGDVKVLEDPDVHSDRYSNIASLEVDEAGWYALHTLYFQAIGTATLELYWKRPGQEDADFVLVPAEAFAHIPEITAAPGGTDKSDEVPPLCRDVGGYEAHMKKTGEVCRLD